MDAAQERPAVYGMLAEFTSPQRLLEAVHRAKEAGYAAIDAFMPYPVEEISHEIADHKKSRVSAIVAVGAALGLASAFSLQYWISVYSYPLNVGGRPLNSWPAFVPVMFELTVLFASFAALGGMLFLNRLPRPHHPLFAVPEFERATVDRFFLLVKSDDEKFDYPSTRAFLEGLGPREVLDVDW
ncbi:MAG TPA: DUF3341 domain-containing protein [Thermoanaerobaculia bacterium]|jgi:hypothetical protein